MTDDGTVNDQVVDSVSSVVTLLTGQSASQAFGMLDAVMLETLGMAMHNAVHRQQNSGMINSAAVTAACAKILATPVGVVPPPTPPPSPPPTPPNVNPLDGPPKTPPTDVLISDAFATGREAINTLKTQADSAATNAQQAKADLDQLKQEVSEESVPHGTPDPVSGGTEEQTLPANPPQHSSEGMN